MSQLLSDYITIDCKSGVYRFKCTVSNEGNIYRKLRELGYRRTKENNKVVYYQILGNGKSYLRFVDIRMAFKEFLLNTEFDGVPVELNIRSLIDWFWKHKNLLRENDLLKDYLGIEMNEL